ncbi:alpha/beta hydrolase [Nocardiopsis dassonvillei]|uniref:alpha/beta hydrolase n=1 Tax=Nocardiopsis dassonvillei TaxID=2014 RepID=UPI000B9D60B6|nr:alpha/beta hydrolase [Nocardiopsis dassonvillei]ASU56926.1 alpha/beta hydrolase [Nocardiopsis dassonvillei]
MSDLSSMSLGLPEDIDADVGAIESGADQLDAVRQNMLGQSEGTHSQFRSSAGEFTDLVAWNIVSSSSQELSSWQEAAASLTYGAAVLRQWGLDIETYRAERAKLETRWEEEKADAEAAVGASEGSGSILGEGTREGMKVAQLESLREELLSEHSGHWETLMEQAEQTERDLRDGPSQESLERLVESSLLTGSQLTYFGDAVPGMVPDELSGEEHPSVVNLWWTSMTEEEQEQAVRDHPELLRELDGIPATVRDRLNRDHLDDEIERFEEEIAERDEEIGEAAARGSNGSDAIALAMANDDTLDSQLQELKELRESLEDESADRYLLALDTEGDGRAIVANGNPDTADNVATLVPGTTTTWESINDQMGRADALADSANRVSRDEDHSVISWIGYDAPNVPEAAFEGRAEDAVSELSSFQDGLRSTHQGPPSHNTVIGHSYGSTVVGHTAQSDAGLDTDEVILVGSPGTNADHVTDLNLPAEDVHVSTAENDGITNLTGLTHGMDPTDPEFGANVFESDPGSEGGTWPLGDAHSEYFDENTSSLRHMGSVIAGRE